MSKPVFPMKRARYALDGGGFEPFVDQIAGGSPRLYRSTTWRADVAVCLALSGGPPTSDTQIVDLTGSGYASMTLEVKATNATAAAILMSKTVVAAAFDDTLTAATWNDFSKQHAKFEFTEAETNITPGTYHFVISALTGSGGLITFPVATLTVLEDGTPSTADDPPANPGAAISLEQADARYMSSSADGTNRKHGVVEVEAGAESQAVVYVTPFAGGGGGLANAWLMVPSGGPNIGCAVDFSTLGAAGFTAVFGAPTPNGNYRLGWEAWDVVIELP